MISKLHPLQVLVLAIVFCPCSAYAIVTQSVTAGFLDPSGVGPTDHVTTGNDRDILAQVFEPFSYEAIASAGVFGNVGVSGFQRSAGELLTVVNIESPNENFNLSTAPQKAVANFIIDGGQLFVEARADSRMSLEFSLEFQVRRPEAGGQILSRGEFVSKMTVKPATDFGPITLTKFDEDIGAFVDPLNPFRVEIPFSFQSLDLGVIPPGARISLAYSLVVRTIFPTAPEGAFFEFSDPGDVSLFGDFPTVEFSPVPEPSSLLLLGIGGLCSTLRRRNRSAR